MHLLIVDEHQLFSEGLKSTFERISSFPGGSIYCVDSAAACLEHLSNWRIDLVITELRLPDQDGLKLIKKIKTEFGARILVITAYEEAKFCKEAFINGADGYLLKKNHPDELMEAVETIFKGNTYMGEGVRVVAGPNDERLAKIEVKYEDAYQLKHKLTKREHEVLNLISQAKTNKQIAKELFISDQTVSVHRKNIMRKLGVRNTASLIKKAVDKSLI
jgi:DNA-binding NarL/FixJ family response regulator